MTETEFTGKTTQEAIEEGLKKLNLTQQQVEITVLEEGGGFLRQKKAKVKIVPKKSDGKRALNFLDELLNAMNFQATGELIEDKDKIVINLITTNSSAVIGYRGEVLDSLQTLAGAIANIGRQDYIRVVVDCENYRDKREGTLKALARKLADKAVYKSRKMKLEPMNAYERRIIHTALSERADIKTESQGREPNRFIEIVPNNLRHSFDKRGSRTIAKPLGDRRQNRGSFKDRKQSKEFAKNEKTTKKFGFGTYLGNSFKD